MKLTAAAEHLPAVLADAEQQGWSMTATLEHLLAREVEATEARKLAGRLRFASLPTPATLADFDFDAAPGVDPKLVNELATCRYLETATNVLLIGPPGVGKTHLAVGLGRAAAEAGYRTYFTTAADLAARCHRAAIKGRWATTMRFFAGPTLLVIDELATYRFPARPPPRCFRSSPSATSRPASCSPPTAASRPGARSSATPPSPLPCSTACYTARSCSTSTASPTDSATTTPEQTPSVKQPPAPADRYSDHARGWGISMSITGEFRRAPSRDRSRMNRPFAPTPPRPARSQTV